MPRNKEIRVRYDKKNKGWDVLEDLNRVDFNKRKQNAVENAKNRANSIAQQINDKIMVKVEKIDGSMSDTFTIDPGKSSSKSSKMSDSSYLGRKKNEFF